MRLSGTCGSGIKGWPHCEQGCQRSLHPARTGSSISHKQSDLTLFVSNATSSGRPPRSHTPLQVASFPPANCSIPPFPNSALPRALFQPPPRLLLQPALCLQAQLLALGSPLRGRKADLPRTSTPRGLQVPFLGRFSLKLRVWGRDLEDPSILSLLGFLALGAQFLPSGKPHHLQKRNLGQEVRMWGAGVHSPVSPWGCLAL